MTRKNEGMNSVTALEDSSFSLNLFITQYLLLILKQDLAKKIACISYVESLVAQGSTVY